MHRQGKWAQRLIAIQQSDGSWGRFHSMATHGDSPVTTEQALARLRRLGCTMEDDCIRRAVNYMGDCLAGRNAIPDPQEKLHNWDVFTALMLSARIREFTLENQNANAVARQWAGVVSHSFEEGVYDHARYVEAYRQTFGMPPRGGRLVDFTSFYQLSLLQGMLDERTETALMRYVLAKPDGMYYVYDKPLNQPPAFEGLAASRYLGAMEVLAGYAHARDQLAFVVEWLEENRTNDGWDLGKRAKDGAYFPLSDDWRTTEKRIADCTERVSKLLLRLRT